MKTAVSPNPAGPVEDIPLQSASLDIWDKKYRLKTKSGDALDQDIDHTYQRIAKALAQTEAPEKQQDWFEAFLWALRNGAIPAGRIVSNAGAQEHKPATSTINCTVSGTIPDSMNGILGRTHEAGLTLKAGCGGALQAGCGGAGAGAGALKAGCGGAGAGTLKAVQVQAP